MAFVVTDQGTATSSSTAASSFNISLGAGKAITVGSLVVVGASDRSTTVIGTVTDSGGNTYTAIISKNFNAAAANGVAGLFYSVLATGLTTAGPSTITYTMGAANKIAGMAILSATGNSTAPLDSAVTAFATGASSTPTVTSGTPAVSGELFVGFAGRNSGVTPITEDAGNGWATPLSTFANISGVGGIGGNQVNGGTGTLIYAPTFPNSQWADFVVGFQPLPAPLRSAPLLMRMGMGR